MDLKRLSRYITRLSKDYSDYQERLEHGEVDKKDTRNMNRRIKRFMKRASEDAKPIIDRANQTLDNMRRNELDSPAMEEAFYSLGREYFTIEDLDFRGIINEVNVAAVFLADAENTVPTESRLERNRRLFDVYSMKERESLRDNSYVEAGLFLSEEDAREVFRNYRKIAERYAHLIGRQGGDGVYGSENLILYMIDEYQHGRDSLVAGMEAMEEFEVETLPEWRKLLHNRIEGAKFTASLFNGREYYGKMEGLL